MRTMDFNPTALPYGKSSLRNNLGFSAMLRAFAAPK
jgi:hypothetical protein